MIPLRDNIPTRRFPVVCVMLIAVNTVIFVLDQTNSVPIDVMVGGQVVRQNMGWLSYRYALIPAYVTGSIHEPPLLPLTVHPAWLTIFTAMFLHGGWLHLGGNMLYLWIFGNNIEDVLGRLRFLLFYLVSGVGAAGLQIVLDPSSPLPMIGASGAIAGVMGAYILLYPGARVLSIVPLFGIVGTLLEVPALIVIGFWIVIQVVDSLLLRTGDMFTQGGGIAYMAHVGGFCTGMLLILLLGGRRLLPAAEEPVYRPPVRDTDFDDRY